MTITNILAEADSWVSVDSPTSNFSGDNDLKVSTRNTNISPSIYGAATASTMSGADATNASNSSGAIIAAGITLLRFNVTTINAASAVSSAILHIYGGGSSKQAPGVHVFPITDNSWTETGVTWNNQPVHSSKIGTLDIFRKTVGTLSNAINDDGGNQWQTLDITSYVATQINGSAKAELMLYPNVGNQFVTFFKSRLDTNAPYITVTYT